MSINNGTKIDYINYNGDSFITSPILPFISTRNSRDNSPKYR